MERLGRNTINRDKKSSKELAVVCSNEYKTWNFHWDKQTPVTSPLLLRGRLSFLLVEPIPLLVRRRRQSDWAPHGSTP